MRRGKQRPAEKIWPHFIQPVASESWSGGSQPLVSVRSIGSDYSLLVTWEGYEAQPTKEGGRTSRESKGKYCFHINYYYTVDLLPLKYQEIQRPKWLQNLIDHFLEQNPGVWLLRLTYWIMGAFTRWKSIEHLPCFLHFFPPKYLQLNAVEFWARLFFGLIPHGNFDQGSILGKKKGVSKLKSPSLFLIPGYRYPLKG